MKTIHHTEESLIEEIIFSCNICFIGVVTPDNKPYVLPMNFGYRDKVVYLHSAPTGFLLDCLAINPNICVTFSTDSKLVFQHPEVACSYRMKSKSVVATGKVEFIEDMDEKRLALDILMKTYSEKEFKYSDPAVANVKVWKVPVENISCKEFAAPHDKYKGERPI